ncbi:MAG: hypothetical protein H0X66_09415 [Verrucomicrobia bacterium]|nr:hypothetical protein [Verrucomicrobiota bacterium]
MRKFIHKVQDLSKKAGELKQTMHGLPGKAAELREAVVMSASELQQIRSDVQSNLHGLRANSEDRLLDAMRQINDHTDTFEEAGYELTGLDLDLAITQRLAVHFNKFEDVPHSTLRTLLAKQTHETIKAILSGLIKAEETAANVELTHLKYDGVIMDIGAVPLIRMLWRSDTFAEQQTVIATSQVESAPAILSAPAPSPALGSLFEQRSIPISTTSTSPTPEPQPTASVESLPPVATPQVAPVIVQPSTEEGGDWKVNALDRFKKMPDLSKSRY